MMARLLVKLPFAFSSGGMRGSSGVDQQLWMIVGYYDSYSVSHCLYRLQHPAAHRRPRLERQAADEFADIALFARHQTDARTLRPHAAFC